MTTPAALTLSYAHDADPNERATGGQLLALPRSRASSPSGAATTTTPSMRR
ncbi:MAG TPA: hypothetical protein VHI51_20205 [Ktedonobacterales bacterium]|nr:hypothetical protein [Ktedonobacterales bacterium]